MTVHYEVGPLSGQMAWAVYDGADRLPFSDPVTYLSRVKHHSLFKYIGFIPSLTIDATVATPTTDTNRAYTVTLGAHGQAGIPYVFGLVQVSGVWVPLKGSIPVATNTWGHAKWWNLTLDETNVYIDELRSQPTIGAALSLPVKVFISDRIT